MRTTCSIGGTICMKREMCSLICVSEVIVETLGKEQTWEKKNRNFLRPFLGVPDQRAEVHDHQLLASLSIRGGDSGLLLPRLTRAILGVHCTPSSRAIGHAPQHTAWKREGRRWLACGMDGRAVFRQRM